MYRRRRQLPSCSCGGDLFAAQSIQVRPSVTFRTHTHARGIVFMSKRVASCFAFYELARNSRNGSYIINPYSLDST